GGDDALHASVARDHAERVHAQRDFDPELPGRLVDAPDRRERVQRSVAPQIDPSDRRPGRDPVDPPGDLLGREDLGRQPLGPDDLVDPAEPAELGLVLGQEQVPSLAEPDVVPELDAEPPPVGDRLARKADRRPGLPLLANPPAVSAGAAAGEEPPVDDEDRTGSGAGEPD